MMLCHVKTEIAIKRETGTTFSDKLIHTVKLQSVHYNNLIFYEVYRVSIPIFLYTIIRFRLVKEDLT